MHGTWDLALELANNPHVLAYEDFAGIGHSPVTAAADHYFIPKGYRTCMETLAARQRLTIAELFCSDFSAHHTHDLGDVGQHIGIHCCTSATHRGPAPTSRVRGRLPALGTFTTVWRWCEHLECSRACAHTSAQKVLSSRCIPSIRTLHGLYVAHGNETYGDG
jgi:hypothetical protein